MTRGPATFTPGRDTVVFVSMSRGMGGPARSLLTVLDHLDDGLQRVLFAPGGDPERVARQRGSIHEHVAMPYDLRFRRLSRLKAATALARYVHRHRGHIVAIHANGQTELNLSALAMLVANVRVVTWAHASQQSPTAGALGWLWRRAGRRVRWLAVSESARQTLADTLGLDPDRIAVVPNPIDPADVVGERAGHDGVRVGYLGLAAVHKGFDLLAPIIREVGREDVGLDLYVAPPNPHTPVELRPSWEDLYAAGDLGLDIMLPGRTLDVGRAYGDCDIVVCPSRSESFGRIAAEAMMNAIPIVASDIPAYRDLVGVAGAGVLFPVDDVVAAAEAIRRLADDPQLRREMGERGRAHVRRYTPPQLVPRLAEAYRGSRSSRRPSS